MLQIYTTMPNGNKHTFQKGGITVQRLVNAIHKKPIFRFFVITCLCLLCTMSTVVRPLVTAYATGMEVPLGTTIIAVIGTLLGVTGVGFNNEDDLKRGAGTFYNNINDDMRAYLDSVVDKTANLPTTPQEESVFTMPVEKMKLLMSESKRIFDRKASSIPDDSGIVTGDGLWRLMIGEPISAFVSKDRNLPTPYVFNSLPTGSPNGGITAHKIDSSRITTQIPDLVYSGANDALRFTNPVTGAPFDFKLHVVLVDDGFILEVSENGKSVKSLKVLCDASYIVSIDMRMYLDQSYNSIIGLTYMGNIVYSKSDGTDGRFTLFLAGLDVSFRSDTLTKDNYVFAGLVDGRTGLNYDKSVLYIPDTKVSSPGVWDKVMDDNLAKNPDYVGPSISIPNSLPDLLGKQWDDFLANQNDLVNSLRDAIAALEGAGSGSATDDVVIGDVGNGTLADGKALTDSISGTLDALNNDFTILKGLTAGGFSIPQTFLDSIWWVNLQFTKCFNQLGDYQTIVLFPLWVGLAMLLIGKGSHTIANTEIKRRRAAQAAAPAPKSLPHGKSLPNRR